MGLRWGAYFILVGPWAGNEKILRSRTWGQCITGLFVTSQLASVPDSTSWWQTHVHKQLAHDHYIGLNPLPHDTWPMVLPNRPPCCMRTVFQYCSCKQHWWEFFSSYVLFRCEKCQRAGGIESLRLCAKNFARLQEEFYVEYTMYDLSSVAVALVFPLVRILKIYPVTVWNLLSKQLLESTCYSC